MTNDYEKNSITLPGAVAMGTGVMIGAGIFALTGQIAELAGPLFPLSFIVGAIVTAFSAYTYIKMSNAFPSAGGIGMILKKAYGPTTVAAGAALLMALSAAARRVPLLGPQFRRAELGWLALASINSRESGFAIVEL
jgi:amino acid transporter